MIKLLFISFLILQCASVLRAQPDYSKLPELQVWYELDNKGIGQWLNYFPDFDTANGGINALTVSAPTGTKTWYNRFALDTANMFQWSTSFLSMYRGDFNGDGSEDFIGGSREIYKGKGFGIPPYVPHVAGYSISHNSASPFFTADFNNDGKDDVVIRESDQPDLNKQLGTLLLGDSDLTKMRLIELPHIRNGYKEYIVHAYTTKAGKPRVLILAQLDFPLLVYLDLWELEFSGTGTETKVSYREISLYESQSTGSSEFCFFDPVQDLRTLYWSGMYFSFDFDKLKPLYYSDKSPLLWILKNNCATDRISWITFWSPIDSITKHRHCMIRKGDPRSDLFPYARMLFGKPMPNNGGLTLRQALDIGDVNYDGIDDIATYYSGIDDNGDLNMFAIYLGQTGTSAVQLYNTPPFSFTINSRHPIQSDRKFSITITVPSTAHYTLELFGIDARKISTVWDSNVMEGGQVINVDLCPYHVAPGLYNLRLSDGAHVVDKGILIAE